MAYTPPPVKPGAVMVTGPDEIEVLVRSDIPQDNNPHREEIIKAILSLFADGSATMWKLPDGTGWIRAETDPATWE